LKCTTGIPFLGEGMDIVDVAVADLVERRRRGIRKFA